MSMTTKILDSKLNRRSLYLPVKNISTFQAAFLLLSPSTRSYHFRMIHTITSAFFELVHRLLQPIVKVDIRKSLADDTWSAAKRDEWPLGRLCMFVSFECVLTNPRLALFGRGARLVLTMSNKIVEEAVCGDYLLPLQTSWRRGFTDRVAKAACHHRHPPRPRGAFLCRTNSRSLPMHYLRKPLATVLRGSSVWSSGQGRSRELTGNSTFVLLSLGEDYSRCL